MQHCAEFKSVHVRKAHMVDVNSHVDLLVNRHRWLKDTIIVVEEARESAEGSSEAIGTSVSE
jgi:hypothetical protein